MDLSDRDLLRPIHLIRRDRLQAAAELALRASSATGPALPPLDDVAVLLEREGLVQAILAVEDPDFHRQLSSQLNLGAAGTAAAPAAAGGGKEQPGKGKRGRGGRKGDGRGARGYAGWGCRRDPSTWDIDPLLPLPFPSLPFPGPYGFMSISLDVDMPWPLALVVSKRALDKYRIVFRFLFRLRHQERRLTAAWLQLKPTRGAAAAPAAAATAAAHSMGHYLCQQMLHVAKNLLQYLAEEVGGR